MRPATTTGPVRWDPELGGYAVTGFDEAASVLRGPGWSSDPRRNPQAPPQVHELPPTALLFMDPPDHTRLRRLLGPAFTPHAIGQLRPRIAAIADAALDALGDPGAPDGTTDLVAELGYLVPLAVIAELLDIGTEGAALLRAETPQLVRMLEVSADAADLAAAIDAIGALTLFLVPLISARQRNPGADFISTLLAVDGITIDEVLATTILLLAAGHETTANLIANGTLALLNHPDQRPHLLAHPVRAVEELLRMESPVQLAARTALTAQLLGGRKIAEGDPVIVRVGAANRDPRRYRDPGALDLTRDGPPHLAFGNGPHFCLGAALARLEATETLTRLFTRYPAMELASTAQWRPSTTFRALSMLPIRLGASAHDHAAVAGRRSRCS